ncbi:MAG TPA: TolC family protein [Bryobacteraceae bacterium]|nr:TolC family protein [Bryobacteraceae bacterium]
MKRAIWTVLCSAGVAMAQAPMRLTLDEAQAIALKNHPQVSAALLNAAAANQVTTEVRSGYYPTLFGSVTGAGALNNSRIAAGALSNPIIYDRLATGFTVGQTITDFGRTSNLVASSRLHAQAQQESATATRADVLLQVNRAYLGVLRAQTVLVVAEQTVAARQLIVDQITTLANSKLRSGLDVSFANVNLGEARLLLANAQNDLKSSFAELSTALGFRDQRSFDLAEPSAPGTLPDNAVQLVADAMQARPELASYRDEHDSALRLARAERALSFPSISGIATSGVLPAHEDTLHNRYAAAGVNVNIPIFNGHLFSARRSEAELRAQAAEQNLRDLENRISRDVQVAWLNASTAYQRLDLTAQLLNQAVQALDLAQTRYDLGLSSIVELSQAQLNKTSAEIASASAKYDYDLQRAVLNYQVGALK